MRLSEIMIVVLIFIIMSATSSAAVINMKKGITKAEVRTRETLEILDADRKFRKAIWEIEIPYWRNFNKVFLKKEVGFCLHLEEIKKDNVEIICLGTVHDEKYGTDGIRIEWKYKNKTYVTQEFIRQRIVEGE